MKTKHRNLDFASHIFGSTLDNVAEWISNNFDPDNLWDPDELQLWVKRNKCPEELFDEEELCEWATAHGFSR